VIHVFVEQGEYVASFDEGLVHAFGATPEEARAALVDNVREQYQQLCDYRQRGRLSRHLADTIPHLEAFLAGEAV
jgi:hypothetical protein